MTNKWTLALAAVGLVSFVSANAEETSKLVPLNTALSATTISGYVDTSANWNLGTGNINPAPYSFNQNKSDGFNLNSVDIRIEKPLDETPWSAGYVAELMLGPDGDALTGGNKLRQAYVALRAPVGNGLDFKVGRFDSIIGYESNDSYKNPNYTRSYGYTLEPVSHTGILAEYKFCENATLDVGVANTLDGNNTAFDRSTRAESKKSVISLLTLTAPKSWGFLAGDALYLGADNGTGSATEDKTHLYAGGTLNTPVKDLTFGVAYDSVFATSSAVNGADLGSSWAIAGYGSYKLTEKLTLNVRGEYVDAAKGAFANTSVDSAGITHQLSRIMSYTGTLQYDLWANVITRLEVRWDRAVDSSTPFGGVKAGDTGTKKNEVLIAANVIYKF